MSVVVTHWLRRPPSRPADLALQSGSLAAFALPFCSASDTSVPIYKKTSGSAYIHKGITEERGEANANALAEERNAITSSSSGSFRCLDVCRMSGRSRHMRASFRFRDCHVRVSLRPRHVRVSLRSRLHSQRFR